MALKLLLGVIALSLPLFAAAGLVIYMAGGKGKPAPTQTEIEEVKRKRQEESKEVDSSDEVSLG